MKAGQMAAYQKRIKVLHFLSSLSTGGVQTNLLSLINNTDKNQFDISIAYSGEETMKKEFDAMGVKFFKIQDKGIRFKDWKILFTIIKLIRIIQNEKIDIIHTHLFVPYFMGTIAALFTGIHVINHVHTEEFRKHSTASGYNKGVSSEHPFLNRILLYRTNLTIALNKSTQDAIRSLGIKEKDVPIIYNGIDAVKPDLSNGELERIRQEIGIKPGETVVVNVGRLNEQKAHRLLINAVPQLLKDFPDTKFFIVGDGPLRKELDELIGSLNLKLNVILLGNRRDVLSILAISDIFVLPSFWEQHPITVLEAMLMEKPVVATSVGGVPETLEDGRSGILLRPNNPDDLIKALIRLIKDKELALRMGREGYKIVTEKFSAKKTARAIESYYLKLTQ